MDLESLSQSALINVTIGQNYIITQKHMERLLGKKQLQAISEERGMDVYIDHDKDGVAILKAGIDGKIFAQKKFNDLEAGPCLNAINEEQKETRFMRIIDDIARMQIST